MYSRAIPEDTNKWYYYIGVDTARAGTASADYTVCMVLAYNPESQEKRIVWFWRKKGLKISEQVEQIAELAKGFNSPVVLVEKNNMGQDFIDLLIDNYNINVEAFTTGSKGQEKENLIRYLVIAFENEKMIMPNGNDFAKEKMKELDRELDKFILETTRVGNEVMKGSGRSKDDMVIALALANRCSQSYGYVPFANTLSFNKSTPLERYVKTDDMREYLRF
jgi:hypothetical protein